MITWQDLVKILKTGKTPPFSLETVPELRRWCAAEFEVESQSVWVWMKTNRLPPHVRQQFVMLWPEVFHKIEYGERGAKYEPKANQDQRA